MAHGSDIVVLTRFAVDIGDGRGAHLDEDWLTGRLELFERYCAPGMAAQTHRPHAWLVLLDHATPGWVTERLRLLAPDARPTSLDEAFSRSAVTDVLDSSGLDGRPTMQLDSDDILLPDSIETMQSSIVRHGDGLHSIPFGFQLAGDDLHARCYVQNPFVCLSAQGSNRHVFDLLHSDVRGERLHLAGWRPGWIQVIHGGNLANEVRGVYVRGTGARRTLAAMGIPIDTARVERLPATRRTLESGFRYSWRMLERTPALMRLAADQVAGRRR
ncbi:MAG: hypothetical protein FGM58_09335 [Acidimicrobiia bacterium]|nr:hypothetical protein [Acidimicrobiia bacterium]